MADYPEGTSQNVKDNFTAEEHIKNLEKKKRYQDQQKGTAPAQSASPSPLPDQGSWKSVGPNLQKAAQTPMKRKLENLDEKVKVDDKD